MYNRQRSVHSFVRDLTGADHTEIQGYLSENSENNEYKDSLEKNRTGYGRSRFSGWGWGIGTTLGTVLYTLCRKVKPDVVIETGVASGVSSSYILCGLHENNNGVLYSIDLSWREGQSGWLVPGYLRYRWQLIMGRSSDKLPPLLDSLKTIDIFLHDSEHTYQNMLFEYQTAWTYLQPGGLLLSHNIDTSDAFPDFCNSVKLKGYELDNLGGLSKN
ncbi:class I SAM-dependent methyltransferase [Chloroflexota bacterium]